VQVCDPREEEAMGLAIAYLLAPAWSFGLEAVYPPERTLGFRAPFGDGAVLGDEYALSNPERSSGRPAGGVAG
jgi:hypothetical protein